MKKIVKLFGIMTIAAALLVSCKPTTEDPTNPGEKPISDPNKTEQTGGSGSGSGTGGTATGSEEEKEKNEEKEDSSTVKVSYTLDTSGIWNKENTTATQTDDKIEFNIGDDWQVITLKFAEPVDMSKGIIINAKISDDWTGNGLKFGFVEEDDKKENETDMSKWSITSTASDITVTADLTWKGYSEDGHISAADLTRITALKVFPQQCRGTLTINAVKTVK